MITERLNNNIELISALIMSLAALLTAWSGFQSSQWDGIQSVQMGEANLRNSEAMEKALEFNQHYGMDGILTLNLVNAYIRGEQELVEYYLASTRPELSTCFQRWVAPGADSLRKQYAHPLLLPEYRERLESGRQQTRTLQREADQCRSVALKAGAVSEKYLVITILFSMILFLGGVESKFDTLRVRLLLISLSGIILTFAIYRLFILPLSW